MRLTLSLHLTVALLGARALAAQSPGIALVGAAYDAARGRTVIVGAPPRSETLETWEWTGSAWARIEAAGPTARDEPRVVYDQTRRRVLLFGGARGGTPMNDTWAFDGTRWQRLATDGPPARPGAAVAYDTRRGRMIVFGGGGPGLPGPLHNDLLAFDGERWTRLTGDSLPNTPAPRVLHGFAYDELRDRLVVGGGAAYENGRPHSLDDAWEWDGAAWHQISFPGSLARDHIAMVYAPDRKTVVLHGRRQ